MNIKKSFKKLIRKPVIFFVTLWANRTFRQGVDAAEHRHAKEGKTIYLACNPFRPDHLVTYNRLQFRAEKSIYGMHARLLTMNTLKRGCYYYTCDQFGEGGISDRDKEKRRRAFVKERLRLARLI